MKIYRIYSMKDSPSERAVDPVPPSSTAEAKLAKWWVSLVYGTSGFIGV